MESVFRRDKLDSTSISELKSALDIYASQYSSTDKLWAYFSSITLAVLGFTVASDKASKTFVEAFIVATAYVVFCCGNFIALSAAQQQHIELFFKITRPIIERHKIEPTALNPISLQTLSFFYWAVVAAVCAGILLITWRRTTKAQRSR